MPSKKLRTLILLIVLSLGLPFQRCINCHCDSLKGGYFDIIDIDLEHYKMNENGVNEFMVENDEVLFENYDGLMLNFKVKYVSSTIDTSKFNFSFGQNLYACSCIADGEFGAKNESIDQITIITESDFDTTYLANDTINDLFQIEGQELNTFFTDSIPVQYESYLLKLTKKPELEEPLNIKVIVELSSNETYSKTAYPIRIK